MPIMADQRAPEPHEARFTSKSSPPPATRPGPFMGDEHERGPETLHKAPIGNLPRRRRFVGREADMRAIDEALGLGRGGVATIVGIAGSGKTALTLEYAHRAAMSRAYPGGVWWLAADGSPAEALARLVPSLRAFGSTASKAALVHLPPVALVAEQAAAARLALQAQPGAALLILDGVDGAGWRAHLPGADVRILATTRDDRMGMGVRVLLRPLSPSEARDVAVAIAGAPPTEAEDKAIDRVFGGLGGLAAAVEGAALAVFRWARTWAEYERYLYAEARAVLDERDPQGDYTDSVLGALDQAIDACPRGTWPRRLLEGAAVFASTNVPIAWATSAAGGDSASLETKRALALLRALCLIDLDDQAQTLSMQILVHRRLRERTEPEEMRENERRGAACVMAWLEETVDPSRTAEVESRRAHIHAGLVAAERSGADLVWLNIADRLAAHLRHAAAYTEARALLERAVNRAEKLDPQNPMRVAESLSTLAALLRDLGEPEPACTYLERALAIDENLYGPTHAAVARDLANLASTLKELGDSEDARPLLERALSIDEEVNGRDHPNTAKTLATLASVLKEVGEVGEAKKHLERALAIEEKAFGRDHPNSPQRLTNLAMVLKDMGQPRDARPLLQRALGLLEATYGPDHPVVAGSLTNLALVLRDLGQPVEAMPLLRRAHRIADKTLPQNHPTRAKIAAHLGGQAPPEPPAPRR
jgi:tetratricopeptide (TPR) repeat protein